MIYRLHHFGTLFPWCFTYDPGVRNSEVSYFHVGYGNPFASIVLLCSYLTDQWSLRGYWLGLLLCRWALLALACVGARICSGLLVAGWCGVQFAVWYVWSMLRTFVTLDLCIFDYVLLSMWLYYGLEPLTHVCWVLMYVLMIWRVRVAFPVYIIVVCRAGCINLGAG